LVRGILVHSGSYLSRVMIPARAKCKTAAQEIILPAAYPLLLA
jgi:hypothetical protein